ncbi:hypothetical protein G4G28_16820 [Massilia sp. Dwa41.01b]|uniref:DUF6597 domain-containing transcriptional factor n=1 Tax=Massilia sp. Dwa41.01b TaxID=2709302 RepID=UPI0016006621|nr:DUF6597 domain-containing transcriptional factor [Massilia sp. Dwa41.01b]QNA89722.1 hypothetical protein G4G28_16820 [Massilia sp. Dwa41.01b]
MRHPTAFHAARPSLRSPVTRIWLPGAGAAGFVYAFIARDARGCDLEGAARLNRFPAGAYCSINWFLDGRVDIVAHGGDTVRRPVARCAVGGCQTAPFASENEGDVHAFIAMFYPDAFHALFGVDLAALQNRFVDALEVLPVHARHCLTPYSRRATTTRAAAPSRTSSPATARPRRCRSGRACAASAAGSRWRWPANSLG